MTTKTISSTDEFIVKLDNKDPYTVRTRISDMCSWDRARKHYGWDKDSDFLFLSFIAFTASRRVGKFKGTYEEWEEQLDILDIIETPENEETEKLLP